VVVDVVDLIYYLRDVVILITEILNLVEEILNLLLLNFKLTVFEVKIENFPDIISVQLWQQISNFIFGDERDIEKVRSEHLQNFENFVEVILSLLNTTLVVTRFILLPNNVVDPLSFLFELILSWMNSIFESDLESLWHIFVSNLLVLWSAKEIIDVISHEVISYGVTLLTIIILHRLFEILVSL